MLKKKPCIVVDHRTISAHDDRKRKIGRVKDIVRNKSRSWNRSTKKLQSNMFRRHLERSIHSHGHFSTIKKVQRWLRKKMRKHQFLLRSTISLNTENETRETKFQTIRFLRSIFQTTYCSSTYQETYCGCCCCIWACICASICCMRRNSASFSCALQPSQG